MEEEENTDSEVGVAVFFPKAKIRIKKKKNPSCGDSEESSRIPFPGQKKNKNTNEVPVPPHSHRPFPQSHQAPATGYCLSEIKPPGPRQARGGSTMPGFLPAGLFSRDPVSPRPCRQAGLFSAPRRRSLFQVSRVSPAFFFVCLKKKKLYIYIFYVQYNANIHGNKWGGR